jgi:membrane protein YdbS with pleckstrin-like domain
MSQINTSGIYGEFSFDRAAVRGYWYFATFVLLTVGTVASFGVLGPFLLLWLALGHWWISKEFERRFYEVDEDSVNVRSGVLFHQEKVIPLEKITDIKLIQGPLMRCFGVYNLLIQTAGMGNGMPEASMTFESREKAEEVRERIMTARRCFRSGLLQTAGGE